jgi:hypothetical protein
MPMLTECRSVQTAGCSVCFIDSSHGVRWLVGRACLTGKPVNKGCPVMVQVRKLRHPNIVAAFKHATVINQVRSCSL